MDLELTELKLAKDAGELTTSEWLTERAAVRARWDLLPRDQALPAEDEVEEEELLVEEDGQAYTSHSVGGSDSPFGGANDYSDMEFEEDEDAAASEKDAASER